MNKKIREMKRIIKDYDLLRYKVNKRCKFMSKFNGYYEIAEIIGISCFLSEGGEEYISVSHYDALYDEINKISFPLKWLNYCNADLKKAIESQDNNK